MLHADQPIKDPKSDLLGYKGFSKLIADTIKHLIPQEGLVIAINGPWGAGKSTVIELTLQQLNEADFIIVPFPAWWYSDTDSIFRGFFTQLRLRLNNKLELRKNRARSAVGRLVKFGSQFFGISEFGDYFDQLVKPTEDVVKLKEIISEKLENIKQKIIVVIDDIDRLSKEDIKRLFGIIKTVGNFPNTIYILAYDREIVERALKAEKGREFLEKIVQVTFTLPAVAEDKLIGILFSEIEKIFGDVPVEVRTLFRSPDFFLTRMDQSLQLPDLIATPRNIFRLSNSLKVTYQAVKGEVNPSDYVVLEIIRLFRPALYDFIKKNKDAFLNGRPNYITDEERRRESVATFFAKLTQLLEGLSKTVLVNLFPALEHELHGNIRIDAYLMYRVSSSDHFDTYFRLSVNENRAPNIDLQTIIEASSSADRFRQTLVEYINRYPARFSSVLNHIHSLTLIDKSNHLLKANAEAVMRVFFDIGDWNTPDIDDDVRLKSVGTHSARYIVENLLRTIEKGRTGLITHLMKFGTAHILSLDILLTAEHDLGRFGGGRTVSQEPLVNSYDIHNLELQGLEIINKLTQDREFFHQPQWDLIISIWHNLEEQKVQNWIEAQLQNPDNLAIFVQSFLTFDMKGENMRIRNEMQKYMHPKKVSDLAKRFLRQGVWGAEQESDVAKFIEIVETSNVFLNPD